MRTQSEIKERFKKSDDIFGTQMSDLIQFMDFETAKEFLKPEYVEKVEGGEETWVKKEDAKADILDYLPFAYEKAENQRGLSAARSMLHFNTWVWLDDEEFYNKVAEKIEDYTDYGIPALDMIAEHYGYQKKK